MSGPDETVVASVAQYEDVIGVEATALTGWAQRVFAAAGCPAGESFQVAENLVQANLYGHDSHGIGLVPTYLSHLRDGLVKAGQSMRVVKDFGAIVAVDGLDGFGQAIGAQAMTLAVERAAVHGLCMIGVANTHHLARIGRWGEQCAEAGFASIHFVNVLSTPLVAPWGGSDARVSTNPICVAVPHDPHPLVLDYATSAVALGKVRVAVDAGNRMAPGTLLDPRGQPTVDPRVMFADPMGALLPFAQHKGYALAVMCELLGGALSGGHVQDGRSRPNPMCNNMLSIVFAPDKLCGKAEFERQVESLAAWLRASPLAPGAAGIQLPGEPERATARERARSGIPLPRTTREALDKAARSVGIADGDNLFAAGNGR